MDRESPSGQVVRLPLRPPPPGGADPLRDSVALREAFAARPLDAAASAFVLGSLPGEGPVLWVQHRVSRREAGRPYGPGLRALGLAGPILAVEVGHPRDVLWAMEEGAGCAGLSAVVGEVHGAPGVLDFRATKRLVLRAEASGVPVWLIRSGDPGGLSAARERWRIGAAPSAAHPFDPHAPGAALWEAELFRARGRPPGRWIARREPGAPDRLRLLPAPGAGALAEAGGAWADAARR